MMSKKLLSPIIAAIFLMLTACGFQLRGDHELPQPLHRLYLEADNPYGSLESSLRRTLRSSDVILTNTAQVASVTLKLYKPIQTNTNTTMGPSSQSRAFALTYQVRYALVDPQGHILLGPENLATSRSLILSANQLPQSNNQSDVLKHEMERDIINQLYNRLNSEQVAELFKN